MPGCILHEFRSRGDLEYCHDMLLVLFHGSRRDVKCRSHLLAERPSAKS